MITEDKTKNVEVVTTSKKQLSCTYSTQLRDDLKNLYNIDIGK